MIARPAAAVLAIVCQAPLLAQEAPPHPTEVQEEVSVRLALIEVAALDAQDRPVPGLGTEDFELWVDGERVEIASMDPACAPPDAAYPGGLEGDRQPRRIVLALDYLHLNRCERRDALEQMQAFLKSRPADAGDEIMVVALDGGVRIEQPLTSDLLQVARTLRRMEYDVTLWAPIFRHESESAFFQPLLALLTALEAVPGRKQLVLFSSLNTGAQDRAFDAIAAAANLARCAIYPVHAARLESDAPMGGCDSEPGFT